MYKFPAHPHSPSFRGYLFQLLGAMHEIIRIGFWNKSPLIWLLNEIFVALLHSKIDSSFFRFEVQMCTLHGICR